MTAQYRTFFGLSREPFRSDLSLKEILKTTALASVSDRFDYAVRLGGLALVTGEVGSGKSTALRYVAAGLHPSEYRTILITATPGSILELYRLILAELHIDKTSSSRAILTRLIQKEVRELCEGKKIKPVLIIDEASLLRLEVFAELHTLTQFDQDSKPYLPIILAGQSALVDQLAFRSSRPLASRIIARCHLQGVSRQEMEDYLLHHLTLSGLKTNPLEEAAITAIQQGSGGLFRKANNLARGALIAAAAEQSLAVTAEHVRLAATEIF
ncbi:MAG: AAA family ATPase [Deltaproteobacteria bacterium]|nr:AAA family ATPase [Deltaproteobacteria bacterium]